MSSAFLNSIFFKNPQLFKSISLNKNIDLNNLNENFFYSLLKSKKLFNKILIEKEKIFFKDFNLILDEYKIYFETEEKFDNLLPFFLKTLSFNEIVYLYNKRQQLNFYYKFFLELRKNKINISNNIFFLIKNLNYKDFFLFKKEVLSKLKNLDSEHQVIHFVSNYIYLKFYLTKEKLIQELNHLKIEYTEKNNIVFFNVINFKHSKKFGSPYWCISNCISSFNQYLLFNQNIQSFIYNFNNIETDKKIIGITYGLNGDVKNCFSYFNCDIINSLYYEKVIFIFKKNINYLKFNFDLIFDRNIEYYFNDSYLKYKNPINIFYFIKYFLNMNFNNFNHYLNFLYLEKTLFSFGISTLIKKLFLKEKISLLIEKDIYQIIKIQDYKFLLSLLKNNNKLYQMWITKINTDENFYYSNFEFISFLIRQLNKNNNFSFLSKLIINIFENKNFYDHFIDLIKYKHFNNFKFLNKLQFHLKENDFFIISKIIQNNKYYSKIKYKKDFYKIISHCKK